MLSFPHFLDNRLTIGRPLPPGIFLVLIFVGDLSRPQGHSAAGRIRSIEKVHLIGIRSLDFPACSIVPQPTTLPRVPDNIRRTIKFCKEILMLLCSATGIQCD
jgi:hypothetical protein